jgi:hypothetical protein
MSYEYKCVAGPTVVSVRRAKDRDHGVKAFEDIMNREAAEGWEFVTVDEFHTSEPDGWLSRKRIYVSSKMLVFRRMKAEIVPLAVVSPAKDIAGPAKAALKEAASPAKEAGPAKENEPVLTAERPPELVAEREKAGS